MKTPLCGHCGKSPSDHRVIAEELRCDDGHKWANTVQPIGDAVRHFQTMKDMMMWLEAAAEMHATVAEPEKARGISERSREAAIANQRGYAAGFRDVVRVLRSAYIGPDLRTAKPLIGAPSSKKPRAWRSL